MWTFLARCIQTEIFFINCDSFVIPERSTRCEMMCYTTYFIPRSFCNANGFEEVMSTFCIQLFFLQPPNKNYACGGLLYCCSFGLLCFSFASTKKPDPDDRQASCHFSSLWNVCHPPPESTHSQSKKKIRKRTNNQNVCVTESPQK